MDSRFDSVKPQLMQVSEGDLMVMSACIMAHPKMICVM